MIYEIFDLYGFADLWQKVVRLSPPATHLEVILSGFFFLERLKCTYITLYGQKLFQLSFYVDP